MKKTKTTFVAGNARQRVVSNDSYGTVRGAFGLTDEMVEHTAKTIVGIYRESQTVSKTLSAIWNDETLSNPEVVVALYAFGMQTKYQRVVADLK